MSNDSAKIMKSNAAGQLLGYSLQFPRALLRLLDVGIDGAVGVEVCGDVSAYFPEGITLTEEDKSSISKNPLTDRSENLWKTFFNWIDAVLSKQLDLNHTRFVLYSNHTASTNSLVALFHNADNKSSARKAIAEARERLQDVTNNHSLFNFFNYVSNVNVTTFEDILPRFELVADHATDNVYDDIRKAIRSKCIREQDVEALLDMISGWFQKFINIAIANHRPAIVSFNDFSHRFNALFTQTRQQVLIDYAVGKIPNTTDLVNSGQARPIYVRQLEIVQADKNEIIEAVSDYFRADSNRREWIAKEIIDESAIQDFENKLVSFHDNQRKTIELTHRGEVEEDRGKLLLLACQQRQDTIADMYPPDRTVQGSYHVLADDKQLGWHPHWNHIIID